MSRKTLIDKVLGSAKRKTQDVTNYQGRAIIQQEKIEKGKKILAPHYPSEEKSCVEAREDPTLREVLYIVAIRKFAGKKIFHSSSIKNLRISSRTWEILL